MEQILLYSNILSWVVQLVVLFAIFLIYRQFGQVYLRTADGISRDGIPIGDTIPEFEGTNYETAERFTHSNLLKKPTILAFISSNCSACKELLPEWNESYQKYRNQVNFVLMGVGKKDGFDAFLKNRKIQGELILDPSDKFLDDFRVRVTPFAFVLNEKGVVTGKGLCNGSQHIDDLIATLGNTPEKLLQMKGVS